jgi:hypothetical protein
MGPIFKGQSVQEKCQGQLGTQVCINIHRVRSQKIEDLTVYITYIRTSISVLDRRMCDYVHNDMK